MEKERIKRRIIDTIKQLKFLGLLPTSGEEICFGSSKGKNYLTYHLTLESQGKSIDIHVGHASGEGCQEEIVSIWYNIPNFDPSLITKQKSLALQPLWEEFQPESPYKFAESETKKILIFGINLSIKDLDIATFPATMQTHILNLVKEVPEAERFIKRFMEVERKYIQKTLNPNNTT